MEYSKYHGKNIFVLNEWITPKKKNVFVFSGSSNDEFDVSPYNDSNTVSITNIPVFVYRTDTIEIIKYKIANLCLKNQNIKELYLWAVFDLTEEDRYVFAQNLFRTEIKLSKKHINEVTKVFFDKKYYPSSEENEKEVVEDFLKVFGAKSGTRSLDFRYNDMLDFEEFLSPNPFLSLNHTTKDAVKTSFMKLLLYRFNITNNTIHFVSARTEFPLDGLYFNNKIVYDNAISDMVKSKMKLQTKLGDIADIVDVGNITNRLELLYFRVLPYSHDIKIDMKMLFKISDTSYTIPFIVYKSKFTSEYKINKVALADMDKKQIELFQEQELKYKDSVANRPNDTIIYYIKLVDNVFFYVLLSENGSYRLKYKFNRSNDVKIENIQKSFEKLKDIYGKLDEFNIYHLSKDTEIFNSGMIEIIDYNTQNTLTFKKQIGYDKFLNNVKRDNPFFQFNKNLGKNILQLQFIDTNNFFNTDSVTSYIYNHMELNKMELIDKLKYVFKIPEEEANDLYEENNSKIKMKISKKGKNIFAVRTYHTGVSIRINIMSDLSVKINTTNTQDDSYHQLLIYYLIHFLTTENIGSERETKATEKKKTTSRILNNTGVTEEDTSVNFNDLLDINMDDLDADIDTNMYSISGINIDSSPRVNIETGLGDFDLDNEEEEVEEEINEEEDTEENDDGDDDDNNKRSKKKTDYTTFVLDRLYKADKKLFTWKNISTSIKAYSSKCGAVNYRQPIVISKKEKDNIDKNHPGSYTGFVQTGSTPEKEKKNFYICPKIWCRVGKVSITEEEYQKHGNKCPDGEEAMFFPKKGTKDKDNYFITKDGSESHWPSLLKENKHPLGLRLPCCGKKPLESESSKAKPNSNYIKSIGSDLLLNNGEYGDLPFLLNTVFNKKVSCVGILDSKSHCYARTGVEHTTSNSLFRAIEKVLGLPTSLEKYIGDHMLLEHYIFLNGGNTLKVFMNNNDQFKLLDKSEYTTFKRYFLNNKSYVKMFNLEKEYEYVNSHDTFELREDHMSKSIIREYLILNSFINFKNYIVQDNIRKNLDDVYHMLTCEWLNREQLNFIFLNIHKDDVLFINPKYYDYMSKYDDSKQNVVILKVMDKFEYVSYVSQKPKKRTIERLFDSSVVSPIVDSIKTPKSKEDPLLTHRDVTGYILSTNLKCAGVLIDKKHVVLLGAYTQLHFDDIQEKSFIHTDSMGDYEMSSSYMKRFGKDFSKKQLDQVRWSSNTNLDLFVNTTEECGRNEREQKFNENLYKVAKRIQNNKKLLNTLRVLNSNINNFTTKERRKLLITVLSQSKVTYSDDVDEDHLIDNILLIPISKIISDYKLKIYESKKDNLYMTFNDLVENKLQNYFKNDRNNRFVIFESSIDDYVEEIDYIKLNDGLDESNTSSGVLKWKGERKKISPERVHTLFPNFEVINEEINFANLINFANSIDPSITASVFQEALSNTIITLYMSDKEALFERYKFTNKNFDQHRLKKKHASVDDYVNLIKRVDYHYSIIELGVLAELLQTNVVIVGRGTQLIEDGVSVLNKKSKQYVMFMYNIHENRYGYNIVAKADEEKYVFTIDDFTKEGKSMIKYVE